MKKQKIRFYFSLAFITGFFIMIFMMFWVEASDSLNMQKGENSFLNELNILIGIIVAAVGQIVHYWFGGGGEKSIKIPLLNEEAKPENPITEVVIEAKAQEFEPITIEPKTTKTEIDKPFWFSLLFFVAYFAFLFTLLYFETAGSSYVQQDNDNFLDILIILLGVLTAGVSQILNYWFKKENQQEQNESTKALFKRLADRPRSVPKPVETPPQKVVQDVPTPIAVESEIIEPVAIIEKEIAMPLGKAVAAVAKSREVLAPTMLDESLRFLLAIKGVDINNLQKISPYVEAFEQKYDISTPLRRAHFYAQLAHESGGYRLTTENLNYSAASLVKVFKKYFPTLEDAMKYAKKPKAIANKVYANRMKNGNEASGDGYKYRGRGLLQITGKANYQSLSADTGIDFVNNPDWLTQPQYLLESAGWFWKKHRINDYADNDDIFSVSKLVNYPAAKKESQINGFADRLSKVKLLKKALDV
jgi:putative chitinase